MDERDLRTELDEVAHRINDTVEERRRSGEYPLGLEHELDRHFRQLVNRRRATDIDTAGLRATVEHAVGLPRFDPSSIATSSGTPVGSAIHKSVAKVVGRQTLGALQQVQAWRDGLDDALRVLVVVAEQIADHDHPQLAESVSAVLDRVAVLDQIEVMVLDLERRTSALESLERARPAEA